jgi:DNA repair exonuclease SbcCD ATPase subunit
MEIEIKTLQNIRDSRVKLEITIDPAELEKVYDPAQAAEISRLKTELDAYRRTHVCTDRCTKNAHVAFTGREMVTNLEERLTQAEASLAESRDLVAFRSRVIDELADERNRLANRLSEIQKIIRRDEVNNALMWAPSVLATALQDIRETLSSSPDTGTSQA